jgi:DNA-binding transcriptional LysR family regulator
VKLESNVSLEETIDTTDLRLFARVAELRSVTRAADELGVSKSTVSKSLSALERRLGVRLLERTSRRVALSEPGQVMLARARSILSELDALTTDLRELRDGVRGRLTIAAPPDLATVLMSDVFPAFLTEFPDLKLSLRVSYSHVDLQDPVLDVAIRIGEVGDDRLVARPVGRIRRILVASPSFARRARLRAPKDLENVQALVFSEETPAAEWALQQEQKRVSVAVSGQICAHSFPVLIRAAEVGLGVALIPELLVRPSIEQGTLVRVLPEWLQGDAAITLVHRVGHSRLRRVEAFLRFFERALRNHPVVGVG